MHIGNMRLLLSAYKIDYYEFETISFFSKEEQNESHASTDFAFLCSSRYYTVVILIIMSLIIIFLEAKAMYKIIFKDNCFVNESCSMYFSFRYAIYFFNNLLVFVCLIAVPCSMHSCWHDHDCDDKNCHFGSHCVSQSEQHHGYCDCAGNSHVNIYCFQTNMNYLQ